MVEFDDVTRRLTATEEIALVKLGRRLERIERNREQVLAERDALISRTARAGARVSDIADVLGISRNAVYSAVKRARGQ